MTWKLSIGTAAALGLRQLKTDYLPTTAYIMLGEKCLRNCSFCAQARESSADAKFLSRVAWHQAEETIVIPAIVTAYKKGIIKRVCLQVVDAPNSFALVLEALKRFYNYPQVPVVVSCYIKSVADAKVLFAEGASRLELAMDVADPVLFQKIKGGSFAERWQLLCQVAEAFPGKITTHIIVGLGESETELWHLLCECVARKITVALFAFTPLKGTPLADTPQPDKGSYRRLQIGLELLRRGYDSKIVKCDDKRIISIDVPDLKKVLAEGHPFNTCGCPGCNRPYYNDHPSSKSLYNFHRPLQDVEWETAFAESGLF